MTKTEPEIEEGQNLEEGFPAETGSVSPEPAPKPVVKLPRKTGRKAGRPRKISLGDVNGVSRMFRGSARKQKANGNGNGNGTGTETEEPETQELKAALERRETARKRAVAAEALVRQARKKERERRERGWEVLAEIGGTAWGKMLEGANRTPENGLAAAKVFQAMEDREDGGLPLLRRNFSRLAQSLEVSLPEDFWKAG